MQRNKHFLQTIIAAILIFAALSASAQTATPAALPHCTATTKAGTPCKNYAYKDAPTCYQHTPTIDKAPSTTCGRPTASGTPCKAKVKGEGTPCFQHAEDTPRCNAPTEPRSGDVSPESGKPCQRVTKGGHCKQHSATTK